MSLTLEEREQWVREINRLNAQGWAEAKRDQVQAIQAANPGMSFETAWGKAEREEQNPTPEPTTIGEAANLIKAQNPTLSFEESWRRAETLHPELVHGSTASPLTQHPKIAEQMRKMKALEDDRTADGIERHAKFLAEVRKLMSRDTSITSAEAINRVIREHPELWPGTKEQTATARIGETYLVTAHSVALSGDVPREIMYMPQGRTVLTPSVNGQAKTISVNVTRATADLLQSDLERLLKQNVPPIICFDHAEKRAAAIPKRFTWKEGQGVFLTVDWTSSGQAAVAGHDYGWLSPTFMLNGNGEPAGLPKSGGSIGSLTNRPAFTSIARIAAG